MSLSISPFTKWFKNLTALLLFCVGFVADPVSSHDDPQLILISGK